MLKLPEILTHDQAEAVASALKLALRAQAAGPEPVVADASALTRFDSSALAVLLACRREAQALGRPFFVRDMPPRLRQLAGLYGIASLIPLPA